MISNVFKVTFNTVPRGSSTQAGKHEQFRLYRKKGDSFKLIGLRAEY